MKVYRACVKKFFSGPCTLGDFLQKLTPLTLTELGEVASKGGVWIQRNSKGKILRIRLLKETIRPEDDIKVCFEPRVLKLPAVTKLESVYEDQNYGVWIKPAGVVPQGSEASDHASVLRYLELQKGKEVYLVHRIDRETEGLMLVAYHSRAAALLSELFQKNHIHKVYEAIVLGSMPPGTRQTISASLDDKEAVTHFEVINSKEGFAHLRVTIETGRLHQIRRHLDFIGHPILGDPKYGKGNKNRDGLKLIAKSLSFQNPWVKKTVSYELPSSLSL